jgi:hypothetical protein
MTMKRQALSLLMIGAACAGVATRAGADASPPSLLVRGGEAVPGAPAGTTFTGVNIAGVDSAGLAFIGSVTGGSGLYNYKDGLTTALVGAGTVGPTGETINSIIATGDYENGVIVFAANTSTGRALYRYAPGSGLTTLVRQGDVLPGSDSPVSNFFSRGVGGDATDFAFRTTRADATNVLFSSAGGFAVPVADDKTKTGVAEMGNFVDFPELHYRDGRTAFVGRGQDPDNAALPPEPAGVYVAMPGNPTQLIAARNAIIPGALDGTERFTEFERPRILPDGRVAFAGGFIDEEGGTSDHHMGVFIRNPDLTWKTYIDSLMELPGLHAPTEEFNAFSIESGVNFFGANDEAGGSYIYYENADGVFTKLIDTYSPLDGKALSRIRMLTDTALNGELFFRADFTDGTSGIYSSAVAVPEPAVFGIGSIAGVMMLSRGDRRRRRRRRAAR